MTDDAAESPARDEAPPSRTRRLTAALGVTGVLVVMVVFVFWLFLSPRPSPVCDHVAKIGKADPHEAQLFVEALGSGDCRSAMKKIEHTLEDPKLTKVIDCLIAAPTASAARMCLAEH